MLDPRIYRAAFGPLLLVLVVVGFSLREPPRPLTSSLAADAFDGAAAARTLTGTLVPRFPERRAGSPGDERLATFVAEALRGNGFRVSTRTTTGQTADGERSLRTVIGERTGFSSHRIVVLAHRDALGRPAAGELSATAAQLELAHVLGGRTLNRTLVIVSTSGGASGGAGADAFARAPGGTVDAVIVLGSAGAARLHQPYVLPWSDGRGAAPLDLQRTAAEALRVETGLVPQTSSPAGQWARLAFPLTLGEQGPVAAHGLSAVLLSGSGERPPADDTPEAGRMQGFGRALLRTITALDAAPPASRHPTEQIVISRQIMPGWAVRLLVAAFILPGLVAAVDGFARVRRRRHRVGRWLGWVAAGGAPFLLAASFVLALGATGLLGATPPHPVGSGAVPLDGSAVAALVSVVLVLVAGWLGLRPLLLRLFGVSGATPSPAASAALVLSLTGLVVAVWVGNPYMAALLLPALHAWLLVAVPELPLRRSVALALALAGLVPLVLLAAFYALAFGWGPLDLAWGLVLLVAGGQVGLTAILSGSLLLGCFAGTLTLGWRAAAEPPLAGNGSVRGPLTYAGPGSLGGTKSALRR